jgi:hypothetical protein
MRIQTGRSIAIMCPALSTRQHVRWPRWVPQSSPKQQRGKAFAWNSIHIEFAAKDQPLTEEQMFWGADLLAWISREHPNERLVAVGTSNKDPGDKKRRGITSHSFVELVAKVDNPKLTCLGVNIIDQMNNKIAILFSVRAVIS